jgi:conjugal transfer ATP-binding protein TraC
MPISDFSKQWSEKITRWLGDSVQFGVGKKTPSADVVNQFFDQYPLSSLLLYDAYDPETEIFHNKKSIGFVLEASPMTGASEQTIQILANMLTDVLPPKIDLQILLWASDKIGAVVDAFVEERSCQGEIFSWLAKKREDFLKAGTLDTLVSDGSFILRDFKLHLIVSTSSKGGKEAVTRLVRTRHELNSSLASAQITTRTMPIEHFIGFMTDLINPTCYPYSTPGRWNEQEALSLQLTDPDYCLQVHPSHLRLSSEHEDWDVRCFTAKDFPKHAYLGDMHNQVGQLFNTANQIPCPFLISLHIRSEDGEKSSAQAQLKLMHKDSSAKGQIAKFKPSLGKEQADWTFVRDRVSEGDRIVKIFYQVVLYARPHQADEAENKLKNVYKSGGWKLKKTIFMQLQSWLTMFPMMMSEGMFEDLKVFGRLRTMNAFASINLAPLVAEWKGLRRPSLLLPGRRGQIAIWNPFDNQGGNYNVAIAAASGSGKSAFTQEYIVSMVSSGGRVWVIDVGRSYEKTCRTLGGEFIEFKTESIESQKNQKDQTDEKDKKNKKDKKDKKNQKRQICINPFTYIQHFDESLEMLKPLAAAMARPTSTVSDEELAWLEKALKAAWDQAANKATMSTVSAWLAAQDNEICQRLAHLLFTYTKDGMYGRYFEGDCSLNLENNFVVLELEELKAKKDLQKIVLFVLMYHVSEKMYLGDRTQTKSCVIDEAWDLLGGENTGAANFIETGYRRARRYNANFVTITQSINDYFKNPTAIAAYENSAFKVILRQEPESINQLMAAGRLDMDEYGLKLLKSLKTTTDYAECMIKSGMGISIHRIIFDPYSRILYSSKGEEFEAVKMLQAQGVPLIEAVSRVAEQRFKKN